MRPVLAALLVCALAPAADAKCAMWGLKPDVMTKTGATIAADGGILVGAVDAQDRTPNPGDAASQPGWRLKLGATTASPTLVPIAPGLVLYKLPADAKEAVLVDGKQTLGSVKVGPKTAVLGAPKIKRVGRDARTGRRPYSRITVELTSAPPVDAVALVLVDAKGTPRSWGKVVTNDTLDPPDDTKVRVLDQSRCRVLANGTVDSRVGDRVTAFWVDASGRKSPVSNAATVVADRVVEDE